MLEWEHVGSICERGMEVCDELRKWKVDVCCLREVQWKGQGTRFLGIKGRKYKIWWSGNNEGIGGVCQVVFTFRTHVSHFFTIALQLLNSPADCSRELCKHLKFSRLYLKKKLESFGCWVFCG